MSLLLVNIEIEIKYFDIDKKCAVSYNELMMRLLCLRFPRKTEERNGSQLQ